MLKTMFQNRKLLFRFCFCEIFRQNLTPRGSRPRHISSLYIFTMCHFCLLGLRGREKVCKETFFLLVSSFSAQSLTLVHLFMYLCRQEHKNSSIIVPDDNSSDWGLWHYSNFINITFTCSCSLCYVHFMFTLFNLAFNWFLEANANTDIRE